MMLCQTMDGLKISRMSQSLSSSMKKLCLGQEPTYAAMPDAKKTFMNFNSSVPSAAGNYLKEEKRQVSAHSTTSCGAVFSCGNEDMPVLSLSSRKHS